MGVGYRVPDDTNGVPGAENPGIVGRAGGRFTGLSLRIVVEDRFLPQIRQKATNPAIRARPIKPPTTAAIGTALLSEIPVWPV